MPRVTRVPLTIVTALALMLGILAQAFPAGAAPPLNNVDWSAIYFTENVEFHAALAGDEFQFVVQYTNLGQKAWVKGTAGQQAVLGTRAPLDNTSDFAAGWAVNWPAPDRLAVQDEQIVQPGREGTFIWTGKVPSGAATGQKQIRARPLIEGAQWLEDYGYYQGFNVVPQADCTEPMPDNRGCVKGTVTTASGAPAANVCVSFGTAACTWLTNAQGVYSSSNVPGWSPDGHPTAGQVDIFFDQDPSTKTRIQIKNGEILIFDFQLP